MAFVINAIAYDKASSCRSCLGVTADPGEKAEYKGQLGGSVSYCCDSARGKAVMILLLRKMRIHRQISKYSGKPHVISFWS